MGFGRPEWKCPKSLPVWSRDVDSMGLGTGTDWHFALGCSYQALSNAQQIVQLCTGLLSKNH